MEASSRPGWCWPGAKVKAGVRSLGFTCEVHRPGNMDATSNAQKHRKGSNALLSEPPAWRGQGAGAKRDGAWRPARTMRMQGRRLGGDAGPERGRDSVGGCIQRRADMSMKRVIKRGIEAASQAALGPLVVAALGSLGYPAAWAAAPPHGAAASAPADPCQDHGKWVQYHVAAIDVKMVSNRFGDRNGDAFMYVLDKNIDAVRAWELQPGCTSWDPSGSQKQHKSCVSTGLRNDLVQPLVLRANLGQCLVIHFTNRLNPHKIAELSLDRTWPNDGKASLDISGLAYSVEENGVPVPPTDTFARTGGKLTYKIPLPTDPAAERGYYFQDGGANRQRVAHGLFGVIVAEPAGSEYLDPMIRPPGATGWDGTGWEAIIKVPDVRYPQRDFREFVVIYHEIGDEDYAGIIDGTGNNKEPLPQIVNEAFRPLELVYRPGGRALNYRSEPFLQRLAIQGDKTDSTMSPFAKKKALAYSSYTFGDPATPIPRSYLGEPTKTRLVHGGSEVFHVHHLHGGGDRWRRPKADPNNDIASGLNKRPKQDVFSTHLDSQTIGPGTSYNLEHECGAGGCQQAAGDFLYHCHIGHHYIAGMWGLWRVFDTWQEDLAKLPDMPDPPKAVDSTQLVGKTFGGKTVVVNADPNNGEVSLQEWVESQLPPKGQQLDCDDDEVKVTPPGKPPLCDDATVWNWDTDKDNPLLYLGEPETKHAWANYEPPKTTPGKKRHGPEILFNSKNGRYAWPLFRPHLGQRPPFAPNGHSGAPWLGEQGSTNRRDGLCPDPKQWGIPSQTIRHYPISAVPMDISRNETVDSEGKPIIDIDDKGKLFVLNEDIRGETLEGKVLLDNSKTIEPLVIRSNVGDCVRVTFTSKLQANEENEDKTASKVNMHTHFVQFDPQASDGVITGFSYEQSVRPYGSERRSEEDTQGAANEKKVRRLERAVSPGPDADEIVVNQSFRLREGIWIGVGLGEGICDATNACCTPQGGTLIPRTEIRRITDITENQGQDADARTYTIALDQPLRLPHEKGEAVGVEFVQYNWYSDVDTGTVFWHDHVEFSSWGHGLASAHVIEPAASTWHDPKTGKPVRRGAIADIHTPPDASVGAGQRGSFREFVLLNIKQELNKFGLGADGFGLRKATINLRNEPIVDPRTPTIRDSPPATGRNGAPAYWFSSVTHGDPATPLPRAYVGDPFVIRHLGVLDREGGIRLTGHRFRIERFAEPGAFSDGSPIGISERYDLVLDGGAGGPLGKPGDFLYYNTLGRDMLGGAWGLIRVHDTLQEDKHQMPLKPLPDRSPPRRGEGFPRQTPAPRGDNSGPPPGPAPDDLNTCPPDPTLPPRPYDVEIRQTQILRQARLGDLGKHPDLTVNDGIAFTLAEQPESYVLEPLVLRVNEGECLKVTLTNKLPPDPEKPDHKRAGWHVGELLFDPQSSHASAIGLNLDSTVLPKGHRTFYYYADRELGTTLALNLADPPTAGKGAFGAVIVEPKGSQYRPYHDPVTGKSVKIGVFAEIVAPVREEGLSGLFREIVTLFHDSDPSIGHNDMLYPWEAHCTPLAPGCKRDFLNPVSDPDPFKGFTSISYKLNRWSDRGAECIPNKDCTPSEVYSSTQGDPGLVIAGTPGLPLVFRVAAPWGEQLHSFSLSGHRWPLEPKMRKSEQVFAHMLAPGYSFDVPVIGGFGGGYGIAGDFLFRDARMPFTQAGLWGLIRVKK